MCSAIDVCVMIIGYENSRVGLYYGSHYRHASSLRGVVSPVIYLESNQVGHLKSIIDSIENH